MHNRYFARICCAPEAHRMKATTRFVSATIDLPRRVIPCHQAQRFLTYIASYGPCGRMHVCQICIKILTYFHCSISYDLGRITTRDCYDFPPGLLLGQRRLNRQDESRTRVAIHSIVVNFLWCKNPLS